MAHRLLFSQLLSRADDDTLTELLGRPVVRLLTNLDPALSRPSNLRKLVLELHHPKDLVRDTEKRNTLFKLLKREEAQDLALRTKGDESAEPFVALMNLKARKNSRTEELLFNYFGIAEDDETLRDEAPSDNPLEPTYGLFEHQRDALKNLEYSLSQPPHRAVLHMPTGSGKTRTAMNLIADHLRRHEPSLVVWLAYSEELCAQTAQEFEEAWTHLGNRRLHLQRFWGSHNSQPEPYADGFLVAGLAKMYASVRSGYGFWASIADRTSLVVIDEAHQAIAHTYREVLELLVERHHGTKLMGLTATPGRTWNDVDADAQLASFFGNNKVTLSVRGYDNPVDYLIKEGYLAHTEFRSVGHETAGLTENDINHVAQSLDLPRGVLEKLASDEQRNLLIVDSVEALAQRHSRILVFAATVQHAEMLAVVLRARGIEAAAVTANTPNSQRTRLIRGFRSRDPSARVLCNYGVLTAGFDAPNTSAAVIARPTRSLVLYSQMVGRAIRGPKVGGNEAAEIVTVIDLNLPGFRDLAEAFFNWEDVWND